MCNPDDEHPCVDGHPPKTRRKATPQPAAQRNHDALKAMGRALLASGQLGQHNGLPATIIVSTTLQNWNPPPGRPSPPAAACCRCATSSGWPPTPTTTW